jgi:nitrogen-specific signal transduction histidine kinase
VSIKAKQVAGVTIIVGLLTVLLGVWYLSLIARVMLRESHQKAELIAKAILQRASAAIAEGTDPYQLHTDAGLQSILEASLYSDDVVYAAIVDIHGRVLVHSYMEPGGTLDLDPAPELGLLVAAGPFEQARALYGSFGGIYEHREALFLTTTEATEFGSIRVGLTMALTRDRLNQELKTPVFTALMALIVATVVSTLLAQIVLRPIHVISSGLARLGRGELDVTVDLPKDEALGSVGESFRAISARLAADRSEAAEQKATLESIVEHLEDAVAIFDSSGALLFANPAMTSALGPQDGTIGDMLPPDHPYRTAVETVLTGADSYGPAAVHVPGAGERLVVCDRIAGPPHGDLGVLLVSRNLEYLSQVQSTLSYSRKLAALSRLSSGIAHEVKNPLNATMIHLELLKLQLAQHPAAMEHVSVIGAQVRRLDEVVQGFLKFMRPEDLRLQPVAVSSLVDSLMPIIGAEADKHGIDVQLDFPADLPNVNADRGLLEQAFLNLGLNACQAMPDGGRLRIAACQRLDRQVEITFADTGVGIPPEQLARIFDLYYTTKPHGTGIGLSLVYRTVQMHDGQIDVESVPGRGTTFRVLLPQAVKTPARAAVPAS